MPGVLTIVLIPLLPLATFLVLGFYGKKVFKNASGIIGTLSLLISFILAVYTAYGYFFDYSKAGEIYTRLVPFQYTWLEFSKGMSINMGIMLDPISVMMIVVITLVSLMVHIYSLAYMKGEARFSTYYSFLSLFTFSMLGLVLSSNIFQIYIFWELVGVSSFLLIGFYYDRPSAVAAAKKAFIVTRFADLGFLIGILILSFYAHTLDFNSLISVLTNNQSAELKTALSASFLGVSALAWGLMLVFIGGAGKSALFPLHIWLPDAMEGPTPVSALIHAATMVVAGVFLIARLFPVYAISAPEVLQIISYAGIISALLAAIIACTQTDIKRVLAFSTMSQIGFMIFALGISGYGGEKGLGYTASLFHLFTHAMFKALLFLAAGSIIHFIHSNEMKDMGGLRKFLPLTRFVFLIGCLAISGIPPFAGFFSKEEILLAAFNHNFILYWIALITSGLTAFYMFRLYFSIFWKDQPVTNKQDDHVQHETLHGKTSLAMKIPLIILTAGAVLTGFIQFGKFISSDLVPLHSKFDPLFSISPVAMALIGIFSATWLYKKQNDGPDKIANNFKGIYQFAYHKFYIDELYLFVTKKILFNLIGKPAAWFDRNVVDGLMNKTGNTTQIISERIKKIQSGKVQQYSIYFLVAVLGLTALFIYLQK